MSSINGMPLKMVIEAENLEQTALIRLIEVDMTMLGGTKHYMHNGLNELDGSVVWQGIEYEGFPAKIDGIQRSSEGASNRPTLVLSNITGIITGLFVNYKELVGAKVTVKDVYAKFLDAVNFKGGVNKNADPSQEYITIYEVQKVNSMTRKIATFELSLPVEAQNTYIPKNVITCNNCQWRYRDEGCGYTGDRYFDRHGKPVGSRSEDECGKLESDCILRFGSDRIPIRIFPSAKLVQGS